ncbi:hypothetical protein HZP71_04510 [Elizabethkingia anophelis]|nr:hypothetical protein [Elizabethkingia anophelis]
MDFNQKRINNRRMETKRTRIPTFISIFFILLFCYAAISKIMDFEKFQIQMTESPLLSTFAGFLPYVLVISEFIIAGLLCYRITQNAGLLASFILMLFFTGYIAHMLLTSENLPCSCGGILEKMSWTQHLYFNIGCAVLAAIVLGINIRNSRPAD